MHNGVDPQTTTDYSTDLRQVIFSFYIPVRFVLWDLHY
jgi:hypothetical protein